METLFQSAARRIGAQVADEHRTLRNPLAPTDFAHPSLMPQLGVSGGRGFRDKFVQGFLAGNSTSQFQGVGQNTGLRRAFYNDTLDPLLTSTATLLPSWKRNYAFSPGLGLDALQTKIIWTPNAAGDVGGPAVPNYGYLNRTGRGGDFDPQAAPITPLDGENKANQANTAAPVVLSASGGTGLEEFLKSAHQHAEGATRRRLAKQDREGSRPG